MTDRVVPGNPKPLTDAALLAAIPTLIQQWMDLNHHTYYLASRAIEFEQTTDPGVAGQGWNDQGINMFSQGGGGYTPSLRFSDRRNSQYVGILS